MAQSLKRLLIGLLLFHTSLVLAAAPNEALLGYQLKRLHSSEIVDLQARYTGKPLLFINTASHCGYTSQFRGLEALHQRFKGQGLMVAGFPSDSFRQEAKDEAKTADVCFKNFGVTFDMYAPIPVKGDNAHPLFKELARQSQAPKWNFFKYLIDRDGTVVAVFPSTTKPDAPELTMAIEKLLGSRD